MSQKGEKWITVVHNDPVYLAGYVQWVLEKVFALGPHGAFLKTREILASGRTVVSSGQREQMESDAQALNTYGVRATIEVQA